MARLIDTGPVCYPNLGGGLAWRPCRTWLLPDGAFVSVVTEIGEGTSVTDQAEHVAAAIRATYPSARIIEHYRAGEGLDLAEHYDEVHTGPGTRTWWQRIPTGELAELLGDLTVHYPAGPVIDGAWPSHSPWMP